MKLDFQVNVVPIINVESGWEMNGTLITFVVGGGCWAYFCNLVSENEI